MSDLSPSLADPQKEANEPSSPVARFGPDTPLLMDCGAVLDHWQIAYQTYGSLNAAKSNAILVCQPLPASVIACVLCRSSQALTQRVQMMHICGSNSR